MRDIFRDELQLWICYIIFSTILHALFLFLFSGPCTGCALPLLFYSPFERFKVRFEVHISLLGHSFFPFSLSL